MIALALLVKCTELTTPQLLADAQVLYAAPNMLGLFQGICNHEHLTSKDRSLNDVQNWKKHFNEDIVKAPSWDESG